MLTVVAADAQQHNQGSDQSGTGFSNPANWTRTIIDKSELTDDTLTFYLNPCEYVIYQDTQGRFKTCMARPACDHLDAMEETLENAMAWWGDLDDDALTFAYGGVLQGAGDDVCVTEEVEDCPAADGWTDDGKWVVTRTYLDDLDQQECPDDDSLALEGAGCLRFYEDDSGDTTTRYVREGDIVFPARQWDNTVTEECPGPAYPPPWLPEECEGAWELTLAHEIGHCMGLGHSWLTRRTLEPLESDVNFPVDLVHKGGLNAVMSYDRWGMMRLLTQGVLSLYDIVQYVHTYSSDPAPEDEFFAITGTVVADAADNDCGDGVQTAEPLFGAVVVALRETVTEDEFEPVQLSVSGIDPLADGAFRLEHLDRGDDYRVLVIDGRNSNHAKTHGWDFQDTPGNDAGLQVRRTDLWSETNSGPGYSYDMVAQFVTGFGWVLGGEFGGPGGDDDQDEGQICVEFNTP